MSHSVTLKLYASLAVHLPSGAERNTISVPVDNKTTVWELIDAHSVPREACHLVLVNGLFLPPASRGEKILADGDTVAVWPPVAGG